MREKRTSVTNSHNKSYEVKEKNGKFDHKTFDFFEDCQHFVNFCKKKSYEMICGAAQITSSSKLFCFLFF